MPNPVGFGLFRWSNCLCSTFFSTDNLAKSDFPGEILSHGKLSLCPSQRWRKGLLCSGSASPARLKEASMEAHALDPHQACGTLSQPRIFKASPPNSAKCFVQRLCRREPLCVQRGRSPAVLAGISRTQGMPWCSTSALHPLLHAAKILSREGGKLLGGSCCSRARWLVPWGLKSCRQGGQCVPTMLPCKQLQLPDSPKNPSGRSRPKPAPSGREGEAELCPLGARGQIPIQGSEVANPPHLLH